MSCNEASADLKNFSLFLLDPIIRTHKINVRNCVQYMLANTSGETGPSVFISIQVRECRTVLATMSLKGHVTAAG